MPWQNNEDDKKRSPWGNPGPSNDGGKGPWGDPPKPPPGGNKGNTVDFDDFVRRSQERLRNMGNGGGGGGRNGGGLPNLPWGLIAGGVIVALLASTSAFRVDAGERAVITRFGQFSGEAGPGFHFKLPSPIDQVQKVNFEDIQTLDIGSTSAESENLMLTGDQNIIDIAYAIRWRVKDAPLFLFQLRDPQNTIQEVAESAMRAEIGRVTLNAAIGPQRAQIADQVRDRMQELLDSYNAGVTIQGVDIKQADPPAAVDEAFKDVSAAQQDREQFLNQARAYAEQIRAQATGAAAEFDAVYAQYRLAPEVTRKRIYLETMENVLAKVDKTVVEAGGVQTYLPLPEVRRRSSAPPAQPQPPQTTVTAPREGTTQR